MTELAVIFLDVGGVLLSNGWDRHSRREACRRFDLDWDDFQDRHDFVADAFERGETDLGTYLDRTVFYRSREFTRREFVEFMHSRSTPIPDSLETLAALSRSGRFVLATLNNESRELNEYRIKAFGLRDRFHMFLSSCYLGVRKPEPEIYETAVDIVQRRPEDCLLVDDRDLNLECAAGAGIRTVRFERETGLAGALAAAGIRI